MLKNSKKFILYALYILSLSSVFIVFCPTISFGAYPKLIATIISAFDTIETWLVRIATPAAAVSVRYRSFHAEIQLSEMKKEFVQAKK